MRLTVSVQYVAARAGLPAQPTIAKWAGAALRGIRKERITLSVRLVGTKESARLNRRYRAKPGPTNVLSFPFACPPGAHTDVLGDLVICAPVVRREARQQGKAERAHWAHMVVHGILHLRGYDHKNRKDAATMETLEIRILKGLGFPSPYVS